MNKPILTLIALGAAVMSFSASAQYAKPEDAVKYRKAAFTLMSAHTQRMGQMAQGKVPFDAKSAAENAEIVADLAKLPWAAFVEGSETADSKAKPEIWKQGAKFKELSDKFQADTAKLAAAAKTGKEDAFKTAFSAAAGNCKTCHDDFRNK